jgi:acetyl esterase/lipase
VFVHGGAWFLGSKDSVKGEALFLLEHGYAVAAINYRLSQHALFPAQIEDCKAAVRWLRANAKEYQLDPNRIAAMGSSAGGHLVALLGTTGGVKEFDQGEHLDQSSRVQAVVDWYGPTDFLQMGGRHNDADSPESKLIGGPIQEHKEKAARANPIVYVAKDHPPFLIMHGDRDGTVPFNQSELLAEALKKAGVAVDFVPMKGAKHGGPQFKTDEAKKTIAEFLAKHLKETGREK